MTISAEAVLIIFTALQSVPIVLTVWAIARKERADANSDRATV